jgi:hypothetical protein
MLMRNIPTPAHLEIDIDEWMVGQRRLGAVTVSITWRDVEEDPDLITLLAKLPAKHEFIPIKLVNGKTELALKSWRDSSIGKGISIFESARNDFEDWGQVWTDDSRLGGHRRHLTEMVRRYVPDFDELTDKEQVDLLIRTQEKINGV